MAKRNRGTDQQNIEKRLKEGRGDGRGADYQPWLRIQDVPSQGLASRAKGWKTGREHHLMSNLETSYLFVLDWSLSVLDVREQFPLLPLEETQQIAEQCGFIHPTDPQTQQSVVITTDFLITLKQSDREVEQSRAIKPAADLQSQRTLEKLEIERRYWERRSIDWGIVTEQEIPKNLIANLKWLRSCYWLEDLAPLDQGDITRIETVLTPQILQGKVALTRITNTCDDQLGLSPGTSLSIVRYLIANRRWHIDLSQRIQPSKTLKLLSTLSTGLHEAIGGVG
ncbi:heteromeric transposase endonuclease subunit TnsA [Phormidium sp. CLA17]|uniref:TnsA endonuclease N-terminal domain-containing protein n=1 Tax=Leptolyngbya sp. Cla-17 TaxID=2803751 RepID=UPI00149186E5|nr:TnsA endonuclease N-terminal domain-containing protein [Leptolyngbya sp. Cla-17]MBM0744525.1 heteromeric transposase endonuclease subunit TnsA [Leptolyngbya sp. Cla-17]